MAATEYDRFSEEGQEVARLSAEVIQRYGHNQIDTEHLLLALVEQSHSIVSKILTDLNIDTEALAQKLDKSLRFSAKASIFGSGQGQIFLTPRVKRIIETASEISSKLQDNTISSEHIFLAILTERDTQTAHILESLNLTSERANAVFEKIRDKKIDAQPPTVSTASDKSTKSVQGLKAFLCHSSVDKPMVRKLYHRLVKDGINPWLDEENLLPGHDWQLEIPKAVRTSDVVIVCLSKGSITKTGYVQKEIKQALDVADEQPEGTIFIVPLKLEECEVPERLSKWQWVNLFDDNGYQRLIRSLNARAETMSKG